MRLLLRPVRDQVTAPVEAHSTFQAKRAGDEGSRTKAKSFSLPLKPDPTRDSVRPMDAIQNGFIERQIRRVDRNLILVNGILLAGLFAVVALNYRYAINFVRGAKTISTEDLLAIQDPERRPQFFVQVTGDRLAPTGFQHVEQQINESTNKVESESV